MHILSFAGLRWFDGAGSGMLEGRRRDAEPENGRKAQEEEEGLDEGDENGFDGFWI